MEMLDADRELRVLVADDDAMTRRMLCAELARAGIEVVGEAADGNEAFELAVELEPDIALIDAVMRDPDGIATTRRLTHAAPEVGVVVLSASDDEELGMLALQVGAIGFLSKDIDLTVLPRVLRAVHAGEAAVDRRLTRRIIHSLQGTPVGGIGMRPVRSELTEREWEILDLLCAEQTTEGMSIELGLSTETIRSHIKSIFRKLDVHSRAEAVESAKRMRVPQTAGPPDLIQS